MSAASQVRVRASISPVVEALVTSLTASPLSQYVMRSGIISSRSAASAAGSSVAS